jgi:hypothetical protein
MRLARETAKNGTVDVAQAKVAIKCGMEASIGVALRLESNAYKI